jgi:hypothetical protein
MEAGRELHEEGKAAEDAVVAELLMESLGQYHRKERELQGGEEPVTVFQVTTAVVLSKRSTNAIRWPKPVLPQEYQDG